MTISEKNKTLNIIDIRNKKELAENIRESSVPVVVSLWAAGCIPCQIQKPVLDDCATQWKNCVLIVKVNVDAVPGILEYLGVYGIPTLIVFRDGQEVQRFAGVQSGQTLSKAIWI